MTIYYRNEKTGAVLCRVCWRVAPPLHLPMAWRKMPLEGLAPICTACHKRIGTEQAREATP